MGICHSGPLDDVIMLYRRGIVCHDGIHVHDLGPIYSCALLFVVATSLYLLTSPYWMSCTNNK